MKKLCLLATLMTLNTLAWATPDMRGVWRGKCESMGQGALRRSIEIKEGGALKIITAVFMDSTCSTQVHSDVKQGTYVLGPASPQTNGAYEINYDLNLGGGLKTWYDLVGLIDGKLYMGPYAGGNAYSRPKSLDLSKPYSKK